MRHAHRHGTIHLPVVSGRQWRYIQAGGRQCCQLQHADSHDHHVLLGQGHQCRQPHRGEFQYRHGYSSTSPPRHHRPRQCGGCDHRHPQRHSEPQRPRDHRAVRIRHHHGLRQHRHRDTFTQQRCRSPECQCEPHRSRGEHHPSLPAHRHQRRRNHDQCGRNLRDRKHLRRLQIHCRGQHRHHHRLHRRGRGGEHPWHGQWVDGDRHRKQSVPEQNGHHIRGHS